MRRVFGFIMAAIMPCLANADTQFTFKESRDELTNEATRRIIVVSEDGKSTIELRRTEGSDKLTVFIDPAGIIFPDSAVDGEMSVSVTLRSSAMKKPVTVTCGMNYMKYDFCYFDLRAKSARLLFSGDRVTIQMPKTAERMTFPLGGKEYEEALGKVLSPATKSGDAK